MAQNDKGGSDLDIFEGLGKGTATARAPSTGRSVPPPPPVAKPGEAKRTLLGITAPATTPMLPTGGPSASRMPPPPPGRSSLPPVVAPLGPPPAARTSSIPPPPAPSATKPANANASATASVDMDWDEEDEATHIFDEAGESTKIFDEEGDEATKIGVEQASSVTTRAVPVPAPSLARPKATLLGLTAPQVPQPSAPPPSPMALHVNQQSRPPTRPPPPPSSANQPFGRTSTPPPPPMYAQQGGYPQPGGYAQPGYAQPANAFPAALPTTPGLGLAQQSPLPLPPPMRPASVPPPPSPMATLPPNGIPRAAAIPQEYSAQRRGMEATQLVRPQQNRTTLYAALAGGAVLVVGALVLLLTPRTGRVLVNVTDTKGGSVNHVEIFLDGRKQCDTAPCIVDQVGTGPHEVKLFADGYDTPPVQTVSVESRRDVPANFILGSAAGTGIRITGTQPGVKLYIDDREAGPLPQEIRDLSPGDHVIKVAGSERYQPLEKHVSVEKDRVEDLGSVTLKVLKGKATISLGTPGARVYLVSGADRRELPMLPISVDIDTTKAWALEGNRPGFLDYRQAIGFDDGQAERTYVVTLDPKSSSAPSYSPPVYYGGSAPVERPAPAPREAPAPRAAPAPAAAEGGGEGFLTINSIPPSTCFLDGKSLGPTPKVHLQVSAGTHTVKFVNADEGLTKTMTVTVGAGETKPAVAKLN